jgi:hypothetical protein
MSNSLFINASAQSSEMIDKNNYNRWNYKLGDGIFLPKGSTVSVQESFINQRGITGASITIEEDINEQILIGYYLQDTSFECPRAVEDDLTANLYNIPTAGDGQAPYVPQIYAKNNYQCNLNALYTGGIVNYPAFQEDGTHGNLQQYSGYSEYPLPCCCAYNDNGTYRMQPLTNLIDIQIKKGVYSVSKLTEILTEQINNRNVNYSGNDQIQERKNNNTFTGTIENDSTVIKQDVSTFTQINQMRQGTKNPSVTPKPKEALIRNSNFKSNVVGITPYNFDTLITAFKNKNYAPAGNDQMQSTSFNWSDYLNAEYIKMFGVEFETDGSITSSNYDLFLQGSYLGSTDVKFDYSQEKGGFSIGGLSQIRRIPSNTPFGVKNDSEGQTAVYLKRVPNYNGYNDAFFWDGGNNANTQEATQAIFNTLNGIMSRLCGIYVLNWCVNHSKATANVKLDNFNTDFMKFEDFYSTKAARDEAWEGSWMARLGFTYDDVNKIEEFKFYDQDVEQKMPGFTQKTTVDASSITTISTQYNSINYAGASGLANGAEDIPGVKSLQSYNMVDVGNNAFPICNNLNIKWTTSAPITPDVSVINVQQYTNSPYIFAQVYPILTDTAATVASGLPTLNRNPYFIISSDIISKSDIFNGNKNLPLLGIVPVSSLSNEDFIFSSFSDIVTPITNDKFINSLSIEILNSDLTIPELGPNSSVVLKLTFPNDPLTLEIPPNSAKSGKNPDDTPQNGVDERKKNKK